ncbi:MAG: 3-deoxy-manno-octulosonate cytidylyltransferase [Hyphomicrobiales bacterium]|jgi:3-deoxy-manno-octulosonate cytidylyltransferase (CMP-KDO synthetase)|nr:3-deoxy-manno-octulosonate cytidylyltransferase [Hyphomicrobiales bacterium]MDG2413220.1 3-deoxy-manno-octulosonate cytidylyltransferase [Hyphomicrobiales bacterium]|tara:strand:- start:1638 stop:2372 length:735 start_codon:yes stop_codon:yes gene_type:complete
MNNLIIIPARLESTRLPNKPLADIKGLPMVIHVLNKGLESSCGDVIVATSNIEIYDVVRSYGEKAIMTNPDHPSGSDRIFEALNIFDPDKQYKNIVNLQGDLPTIDPYLIKLTFQLIENNQDADISTLGGSINDEDELANPNVVKAYVEKVDQTLYAKDFVRSPKGYNKEKLFHHLGVYGYKRRSLEKFIKTKQSKREQDLKLEQLRALDNGMSIVIDLINEIPIGVDTEDDLYNVRKELSNKT